MIATTFLALSLLFCVTAHAETVRIHAIEPTRSGQIGINRWEPMFVTSFFHSGGRIIVMWNQLTAISIASNTQYYSYDQTTTKWIGVNTEYIIETVTVTSVGVAATSTNLLPFAMSTVSIPSGAAEIGDLAIVAAPAGKAALKELFKQIDLACGTRKKVKRYLDSCVPNYLRQPNVLDSIRKFFPSNTLVTPGAVQKWALAAEYAVTGLTLAELYSLWNYYENKKTGKIPDESVMPSAAIKVGSPNNAAITSKRPYAPYFTAMKAYSHKPFKNEQALALATYMELVMASMFPEITTMPPTPTSASKLTSTLPATGPGQAIATMPPGSPYCILRNENPALQISWDQITEQVSHFCTCWEGYDFSKHPGKAVYNDYTVSGHGVRLEWRWAPGDCKDGLAENLIDYHPSKEACIDFFSHVANCKPLFVSSYIKVGYTCLRYDIISFESGVSPEGSPEDKLHPKDVSDKKKCY